jgi:hypothetical protein
MAGSNRWAEESIDEYDRRIQIIWDLSSKPKTSMVAILGIVVFADGWSMVSIQYLEDGSFSWSNGVKSGVEKTFEEAWQRLKQALKADHGEYEVDVLTLQPRDVNNEEDFDDD